MMTHTRENPYPCELCDKSYSRKYDLKRHMIYIQCYFGEERKCWIFLN